MLGLLSAAHSVLPELAEARIVHTEVNLRPALPDNLPRTEARPGLVRMNGLFRHGWLIAPALVEQALMQCGLTPAAGGVDQIARQAPSFRAGKESADTEGVVSGG
jgi:glycine oxidase